MVVWRAQTPVENRGLVTPSSIDYVNAISDQTLYRGLRAPDYTDGGGEPSPRYGHASVAVGEQLYVWGGVTEDLDALASALHSFHPLLEYWEYCECSGLPPSALLHRGAYVSSGDNLYIYGGYDGSDYQGCLHKLDTKSWKWQQLSSGGPMRKSGCGMIAYGKKLVLFGGYGIPYDPTQPGAQFVKRAWTNELHVFDVEEGEDGRATWYQHCLYMLMCILYD